jgi:hypothetical protein
MGQKQGAPFFHSANVRINLTRRREYALRQNRFRLQTTRES